MVELRISLKNLCKSVESFTGTLKYLCMTLVGILISLFVWVVENNIIK